MRAFGASEEVIQEKLHLTADDNEEEVEIGVWPENFVAVQVFMRVRPPVLVGMQAFHDVVTVQEVESGCRLLRVPGKDRAEVLDSVQFMSSVAAKIRNDRNEKRPIPRKKSSRR